VVARESNPALRYPVRQVPGVVQFAASAREEAVRLARGFAQRHAVNLWYSEDGNQRLLEAYRREAGREQSIARSGTVRVRGS
jgi:hypothetical protein